MARIDNLTNFLTDVASAIKTKSNNMANIPAANFDNEILNLPSQGNYQVKTMNITTNGETVISPDQEYDAMSRVVANVQVPMPQLQNKFYEFTSNQNITLVPDTGYNGFTDVSVSINVPTGIDTSDATAIADDILEGKTAYVNGVKLTGTMENLSNTIAEQENIIANLSNLVNSKASGSGGNTIIPNGLKFAYSTLQNIPAYDMSEITDASKLFYECTNLTNFPVLGNNIINMSHTFYNCRSLNIIENINTTKATDMSSVCGNCVNLTVTPDFDTSNVTNLFGAFKNCSNLTEVSIYNLSVINTMTDIFAGCDNLSLNAYANIVNMLPNANSLTNQYIRNMGISSSVFTEEQINILSNKGYLDFEPQTYYDIYYG